jgi:hypothetical protein
MRAITVSSYGARPSVTELPAPQAGPGQVLVNYQLSMTAPLLDRLAARVAAGSLVPPPITRVTLDDVPALLGGRIEGKTVITM